MTISNIPYLTDSSGQEHPLEAIQTRLGRSAENEIVILNKLASREHAVIRREGRKAILEDLNSTNGTYLNGRRVSGPVHLQDGDHLTVGGVEFVFHDPDMTLHDTPLPELEINLTAGEVRLNRRPVLLSPKELALLAFLHQHRGKVCSKDEIGRAVWSEYREGIFDYQIENLVRRLRAKIEPDPNAPQLLLTVRGLGYKLALPGR
ncbi:MAG: winged helix-turn-helix domain-containing protein [Anaerolineales bacterium]|nr:winged helix-turn-helix domain-containing protein [Anaerolineales bacterium]MCX7756160.1 winged helix-turn-helix domain-containing protein [Anaerolineales bacterium]MDW8279522.1 winged helix-turn-helix domain-containing protein [Anaerolineales bacterium]